MKIEMTIKYINSGKVDTEEYFIDNDIDYKEYANNMIENFNRTLRPNESPRELIGVKVLDEKITSSKHNWEKQNSATIIKGGQVYDSYKCKRCGITGKTTFIGSAVVRDSKYKAKTYDTCEGAMKQIQINRNRVKNK